MWDACADVVEAGWVFEEVNDFAEFFFGFVASGHILKRRLWILYGFGFRLREFRGETASSAAAALTGPRAEKEEQANNEQHRQQLKAPGDVGSSGGLRIDPVHQMVLAHCGVEFLVDHRLEQQLDRVALAIDAFGRTLRGALPNHLGQPGGVEIDAGYFSGTMLAQEITEIGFAWACGHAKTEAGQAQANQSQPEVSSLTADHI